MPIRTDRGRGAVLRTLMTWPLHSRGRMILTVVAVAAVLVAIIQGLSAMSGDSSAPEPRQAAPAPPSSTVAPPTSVAPASPAPPVIPMDGPADPAALAVAEQFVTRWAHHPPEMSSQAWADQLRPLMMPETATQLSTVDPARIPATRVTGPAQGVMATRTVVQADVPTDGPVVRVVVLLREGTWTVRSYDARSTG